MSTKETKFTIGVPAAGGNRAKRPFPEQNTMAPTGSGGPKKRRTNCDSGEEELMEECDEEEIEREWRRCWEGKDGVMKDV